MKLLLTITILVAVVSAFTGFANGQCNPESSPATCEHRSATISWSSCPSGQAREAHAYYGRRDKTTCIAGRPHHQYQLTSCYSSSNENAMSQKVTNWCYSNTRADGTCQIAASNGVFGDPCVGTFKYLRICSYCDGPPLTTGQCNPESSPATCEHRSATISWSSCPSGQPRMAQAYYGRRDKTTCIAGRPHHQYQLTSCYSSSNENAMSQKVTNWCNSNTRADGTCQIAASNGVFGDPCVGTFKYMRICTYCDGPPLTTAATGYNCGTRNPCTGSNISQGKFYHPHQEPSKYVQCDQWGQCWVKPCPAGLVWDQTILTCNWP